MKKMPISVRALAKIINEIKGAAAELPHFALITEQGQNIDSFVDFMYGGNVGADQVDMLKRKHLHHHFSYGGEGLTSSDLKMIGESDLAIFVLDAAGHIGIGTTKALTGVREKGLSSIIVVDNIELIQDPSSYLERLKNLFGIKVQEIIFISSRAHLGGEELYPAIVRQLDSGLIGLGFDNPEYRKVVADRLIRKSAMENAVIGGVAFLPGSDMPLILANQVKLILNISQIYGYELSVNRALEVVSVIGSGLFFRALARQALDVIPILGSVVKGAVAHLGTVAVGKAAEQYFKAELLKDKLP